MRSYLIAAALLGAVSLQAVEIGDDQASVLAELGRPIGELELPDSVRLMFNEGSVTLVDGKVSKFDIKSAAQLQLQEEIRQQMAEQWAARMAEEMAARVDKGRIWLDYLKLSSTPITENDVKALVSHWQAIRRDFPDADIDAEYDATLALAEARAEEIKQRAEEQRIAQLEKRVAAAEQRAAAAEQQASQAQRSSFYYSGYYPAYYYPQPRTVVVVSGGGVNCVTKPKPYSSPYRQPGLQASYSSGNFSVKYSSGGATGYGFTQPSRPIVITNTGQ